jgi:hypothetical protein
MKEIIIIISNLNLNLYPNEISAIPIIKRNISFIGKYKNGINADFLANISSSLIL